MDIIKGGDLRFWMTHNSARKATRAWLPEDDELRQAILLGGIKVQRASLHPIGTKRYEAFEFSKSESFRFDEQTARFIYEY